MRVFVRFGGGNIGGHRLSATRRPGWAGRAAGSSRGRLGYKVLPAHPGHREQQDRLDKG